MDICHGLKSTKIYFINTSNAIQSSIFSFFCLWSHIFIWHFLRHHKTPTFKKKINKKIKKNYKRDCSVFIRWIDCEICHAKCIKFFNIVENTQEYFISLMDLWPANTDQMDSVTKRLNGKMGMNVYFLYSTKFNSSGTKQFRMVQIFIQEKPFQLFMGPFR